MALWDRVQHPVAGTGCVSCILLPLFPQKPNITPLTGVKCKLQGLGSFFARAALHPSKIVHSDAAATLPVGRVLGSSADSQQLG